MLASSAGPARTALRLPREISALHGKRKTGHKRRILAGQEDRSASNVLWLADTAQRIVSNDVVHHGLVVLERCGHGGVRDCCAGQLSVYRTEQRSLTSWTNAIAVDLLRAVLEGDGPRHCYYSSF